MNKALKKLSSRRGETLAETLASVAVVALAAALAAAMLAAAFRINLAAKNADAAGIAEYEAAESREGEPILRERAVIRLRGTAECVETEINVYGGDKLRSYSEAE